LLSSVAGSAAAAAYRVSLPAYLQLTLLTSLSHLDVSSNCLSTIPDSISLLAGRLTFLDVSNNSRVQLPASLGCLSKLVQLNISWVWSDLGVLWEGATGLSSLQVCTEGGKAGSKRGCADSNRQLMLSSRFREFSCQQQPLLSHL
jgi:hypothetical protein